VVQKGCPLKSEQPTILVYNPISGRGHLDSWNAMFVELLLKNGWRVLALTPDPSALLSRLAVNDGKLIKRLQILPWNSRWTNLGVLMNQNALRLKFIIDRYFHKRQGYEATGDMPWIRFWKKRCLQLLVPLGVHFTYLCYKIVGGVRPLDAFLPQENSEPQLLRLADKAFRIKSALKKAKWKPSLAFNMYMDLYSTGEKEWTLFDSHNELDWVGIRFVPPPVPSEAWYRLSCWKGMFLLDEQKVESYSKKLPQKCFQYLPDISDVSLPEKPTQLATEIKKRAKERTIVFLGGSIGGQKNLSQWYKLIGLADPQDWFFVQVGEVHLETLTREDLRAFNDVLAFPPENFLIHSQYLKDESSFNAVVAVSDIIFAVYRDFPYSSNMIGKAAHFRKPILVSDRYLMGERVRKYELGLVVDENDADDIKKKLLELVTMNIPKSKFLAYCEDFSIDSLGGILSSTLKRCVSLENNILQHTGDLKVHEEALEKKW